MTEKELKESHRAMCLVGIEFIRYLDTISDGVSLYHLREAGFVKWTQVIGRAVQLEGIEISEAKH